MCDRAYYCRKFMDNDGVEDLGHRIVRAAGNIDRAMEGLKYGRNDARLALDQWRQLVRGKLGEKCFAGSSSIMLDGERRRRLS